MKPIYLRRPRNSFAIESVEQRWLLAAHIVGNSTVYSTIQAAVDAATPSAVITVDAGTYNEQVFVTKALTIRGAKTGVDARTRSTTGESIMGGVAANGAQTGSFFITADNVTIDGFTVQGETNKSTTRGAGIVIYPGISGTHIVNNIVQNNVAGIFLANSSSTNAAVIQRNLFQNNNNAGPNGGRGIYTDGDISGGLLTNVTIDSNTFINNRGGSGTTGLESAVAFEAGTAGKQTNFRVTNNSFSGNGKAVLFFHTTGVLIQGNSVTTSRDWYSGALRFEGDNHNVTISYNNIFANTGPGVAVDSNGAVGDNSGFVVTRNNIYGNGTTSGGKLGVVFNQTVYDGAFDATNNYWGASTGPSGDGPGTGDSVYGNASKATSWSYAKGGIETFSPWVTSTIDITIIPPPVPYQPPVAPSGLTVTAVTATTASLNWSLPSYTVGIANYVVYRNGVAVGSPTGRTFTDTGLAASTVYSYTVATTDSTGVTSSKSAAATATTPALPIWTSVSLASYFNRIGIVADGTRFTSGGFDKGGYALSTTALGKTVVWNGSTYTFGTAGANDIINAAGQTITLPQVNGTTLGLIAAGINGNQPSQSFVVRYTDGTSQTVVASISDWATPQSYAGEATAVAMTYRNTSTGTKQSTAVKVYGYSLALNSAKTLASVTLPNNGNLNVLAINVSSVAASTPTAPQGLSASTLSSSQIRLNWSAAGSPTSFTLQRSTDGVNFATVSSTIAGTAASYTDTGLAAGTTYTYRLYAVNNVGTSPASAIASATTVSNNAVTTQLSSLPWVSATTGYGTTQLNSSISGNALTLRGTTYASGIGTHAASTIIYNVAGKYTRFLSDIGVDDEVNGKGTGSVDFQVIGDGKVLFDSGVLTNGSGVVSISVDLTGVQKLTLLANSVGGDIDFAHADWANTRLLSAAQAPSAPTNVTAAGLTTTSIRVGWSAAVGAVTGYRVERSLDGTTWSPIATVASAVLTYADTNLTAGTTYSYRVIATSAAGDSPASLVASAKPLASTVVTTQLSSLNWVSATAGYGSVQKNLNASGDPISVAGTAYASGVGTHADSTIVYNLAGGYTTFQTDVGFDDRTAGKPSASVYFQVIADGKVIYDSGSVTNTSGPRSLSLDVTGVQSLSLIVKAVVPGEIDYCHVDWAGAQLLA